VGWDWVHLVRQPLFGLLYHHQMVDDDEYGAVGGMRIGRRYGSTQRKPATGPLCPLQIPHDLTWDWTWAATVGSRPLTTWVMAWHLLTTVTFILDMMEYYSFIGVLYKIKVNEHLNMDFCLPIFLWPSVRA
jgi:hypothetical protein